LINGIRRLSVLAVAATVVLSACSSSATASPAAPAATDTAAASAMSTTAPSAGGTVNCVTGSITTAGSTALQPLIQDAAAAYDAACSGATITAEITVPEGGAEGMIVTLGGRFGGYGYGYGHRGIGVIGVILIVLVILALTGRL